MKCRWRWTQILKCRQRRSATFARWRRANLAVITRIGSDPQSPVRLTRILTPVRNEAPPERVERELAGLVITPDHQEVLAWRAVPARRIVVDAAITDVHSV